MFKSFCAHSSRMVLSLASSTQLLVVEEVLFLPGGGGGGGGGGVCLHLQLIFLPPRLPVIPV